MTKKIFAFLLIVISLYGLTGSSYSLFIVHPKTIKIVRQDESLIELMSQQKQIEFDDKFEKWVNTGRNLNLSLLRSIKSLSAVLFVLSFINIIYFGVKIISSFREKKSI